MLEKLADRLTRWSTRWVPDSWTVAVLLTAFVFCWAFIAAPGSEESAAAPLPPSLGLPRAAALIACWGQGFWVLSSFSMQMCILIVSGYIIAVSPPFRALLEWLARLPRSPRSATAMVALASMLLAFFHWGLSLIASALLAQAVIKKNPGASRPLLITAAYLGLGATWHCGLSGSAPLLVATPNHFLQQEIGIIPVTSTIFHPFNITLAVLVVGGLTALVAIMHPRAESSGAADIVQPEMENELQSEAQNKAGTPAERLDNLPLINVFVAALGFIYLSDYFLQPAAHEAPSLPATLNRLNLDTVNLFFLVLGILLHWTPASLLRAAKQGGEAVWGVILQFPFYAGMFGIIKYSGLQNVLADALTSAATERTLPLLVYWYSGLLNYFVPSGGSKWAIEAPYIMAAGAQLSVSKPLLILAYAWGDMMSDIIQPFWAIPLLGICKLQFRDILGYCLLIFVPYVAAVSAAFLIAPWFF